MSEESIELNIINNFLDKNFFDDLKKLVTESEFPWFQRKNMVPDANDNDLGYFTHSFFSNNTINDENYNKYILSILNKLKVKAPIEVRANLSPSCFFKKNACAFHIDYEYKCKTAILYLNTCDGGTELKINNQIKFVKAEENKIVIFDTEIEHRGTKSTDQDFRYIINFNYFE
tara:strand:- start:22 stop:540 length:519 start_codon:yes stop_codon:yes gene_type:complete